jgi:hypothetical protein
LKFTEKEFEKVVRQLMIHYTGGDIDVTVLDSNYSSHSNAAMYFEFLDNNAKKTTLKVRLRTDSLPQKNPTRELELELEKKEIIKV